MVVRILGLPETERIRKLLAKARLEVSGLDSASRVETLLLNLNELMTIQNDITIHNNQTENDQDGSDSVKFNLSPNEGASVEFKIPTGYVLLISRFVMSDYFDNDYIIYFDGNPYVYGPELSPAAGFLAIDEQTYVQFVVLNSSTFTNEYIVELRSLFRKKSEWMWPAAKSKPQLGTGGF